MTRDELIASLSEMTASLARGSLTVDAAGERCAELGRLVGSATGQATLFGEGTQPMNRARLLREEYITRYRDRRGLAPVLVAKHGALIKQIVKRCEEVATQMQRAPEGVITEWLVAFFDDEFMASRDYDLGLGLQQWNRIWSPPAERGGHRAPAPHAAFAGKGREL